MKKILILLLLVLFMTGCSNETSKQSEQEYSIGLLLTDSGLGDESFNDSVFKGLEKARDELGILFDYREAPDGDLKTPLKELVKEGHNVIIGVSFTVKDALEEVAKEHPEQQFVLIDEVSDIKNITSITFKEQEGSFLVGMVAAMKSQNNKYGFIGGVNVPVINHFRAGFTQGVQYVKPDAEVFVDYAENFGDAELGAKLARKQIEKGADFIYPAAGFTGFGALKEAQEKQVFAAGVDTDQFFVAEKAVITSMLKKVDTSVYTIAKQLKENGQIDTKSYEVGLAEDGVGLAQLRLFSLTEEQTKTLEDAKDKIISGQITVNAE